MTLTGSISRNKVWKAALKVKAQQGWCTAGFNEVMVDLLGFPAIMEKYFEPEYDNDGEELRTKPGVIDPCDNVHCGLCYSNPRTILKDGGYKLVYVDNEELVEGQ